MPDLSPKQVSELLNVSINTARRIIQEAGGWKHGRIVRIEAEKLDEWRLAKKIETASFDAAASSIVGSVAGAFRHDSATGRQRPKSLGGSAPLTPTPYTAPRRKPRSGKSPQ